MARGQDGAPEMLARQERLTCVGGVRACACFNGKITGAIAWSCVAMVYKSQCVFEVWGAEKRVANVKRPALRHRPGRSSSGRAQTFSIPVCVFVRPESQQVSKQGSSGLTAIAGGVLVMAGGVMVFGGSSGGKVTGPCVGLCVVAGGSRRSGSGSCVGPTGHAVLDGVSHWRGGRRSCPEKK
jgi:hypothetical protein